VRGQLIPYRNKLECLSLSVTFNSNLIFVGKARCGMM
jgi:hypothetical protein